MTINYKKERVPFKDVKAGQAFVFCGDVYAKLREVLTDENGNSVNIVSLGSTFCFALDEDTLVEPTGFILVEQ